MFISAEELAGMPEIPSDSRSGLAHSYSDLSNPATYQVEPLVGSPALTQLISAEYGAGLIDTMHPDSIIEVLLGAIGMDSPLSF
jgi:hypothetical protein